MESNSEVGWRACLWPRVKMVPLVLVEGLLGIPVDMCFPIVQYVFAAVVYRLFSAQASRDFKVRLLALAEAGA